MRIAFEYNRGERAGNRGGGQQDALQDRRAVACPLPLVIHTPDGAEAGAQIGCAELENSTLREARAETRGQGSPYSLATVRSSRLLFNNPHHASGKAADRSPA
jgi:hypothetical protein